MSNECEAPAIVGFAGSMPAKRGRKCDYDGFARAGARFESTAFIRGDCANERSLSATLAAIALRRSTPA
ncbi:hypothetical protein WS73_03820 [Burkholderia savannae]|nr:hypothetical protein WS73_03820 [Burkholderia savannae]